MDNDTQPRTYAGYKIRNAEVLLAMFYLQERLSKRQPCTREEIERLRQQALDAIQTDDACWTAYTVLGQCEDRLGNYQKALEAFEHALRLAPDDIAATFEMGCTFQELQQWEKALEYFERVYKSCVESSGREDWNALSPDVLGVPEETFRRGMEMGRALFRNYAMAALTNMGTVFDCKHDYPSAIAAYDKMLALVPNHFQALYKKGLSTKWQGRTEEALPLFQAARKLDPEHVDACLETAVALQTLNRDEEAIQAYEDLMRLAPDNEWGYFGYAALAYSREDYTLAKAYFDACLRINPENKDAQEWVKYCKDALNEEPV